MSNKKLLVEGPNDEHVIYALRKRCEIGTSFDVKACGGIDALLLQLPVLLKEPGVDTIGIIVDADTDLQNRWNQLKRILEDRGYALPDTPDSNGLILRSNGMRVIGVWIMPDNNLNGMLEDFLALLVPQGDELLPVVRNNLDAIEQMGLNRYKPGNRTKAEIYFWLAVQEDPGTPLGQSITIKYLTTDNETCRRFVAWLDTLFR